METLVKKIKRYFHKFIASVSNDIGIDLGTANTLVYLREQGIIITEPSVVAINEKTEQIVAVGNEAKQMVGRTPPHIKVIRPLVEGVISDFEITEEMLAYFIRKAEKMSNKFFRPRVVVGVPTGISNVETRAVYDATKNGGAREVYIVEEPMAAAIGVGLPVNDPIGSMIIDIGGGTTDIAVISLGGVVHSKNIRIAGDHLNADIKNYLRDEFRMLIGEKSAEDLKIVIGTVLEGGTKQAEVRGRDLISGLPKQVTVTDADIREAISPAIGSIIESIREVLETTPPEVLADISVRGITLTGGGALINGLPELIKRILHLDVHVSDDPLTAVARGTGFILDNIEKYKDVLVQTEYDL